MNDTKLKSIVTEAVSLDRQIADLTDRLKTLKADLVTEGALRIEEHTETSGGGSSWTVEGNDGCIARITFPARKLKSSIPGEGSAIAKIREAAGKFFAHLFHQVPAYKPVADFREVAAGYLGRDAKKLIKLCESTSTPSVSFETKEPA